MEKHKKTGFQIALAFIAVIFIGGAGFAQQGAEMNSFVENAISKSVPADQTFQIMGLVEFEGKTAYFVRTSANYEVVFVFEKSGGKDKVYLVDNEILLQGIYKARAVKSGSTMFNATVADDMPALILAVNKTRGEEAVCRQYTGNTNSICYNKEDCQENCPSSPLCLRLAESSWDFFDAIAQFNLDSRNLDEEIAQEQYYYQKLKSDSSIENIDRYLAHVSKIIKLTSNLSSTKLNTDYGMCPVPPFDMTKILVTRDMIYNEGQRSREYMESGERARQAAIAAAAMQKKTGVAGNFEIAADDKNISFNSNENKESAIYAKDISGWMQKLKMAFSFTLTFGKS